MLSFFTRVRTKQERLWHACSYGRESAVKELIAAGADLNWRSHEYDCFPIHVASQGKSSIVNLLLQAGCQVDSLDKNGNTALHHAAMSGHLDNVSMLLAAGAAVDPCNNSDWTPLFNSVYWNRPSITKLLLSKGADPFKKNKEGRNVLHELCRSKSRDEDGLVEILHMLLDSMNSYVENNDQLMSNGENRHHPDSSSVTRSVINAKAVCDNGVDFEADFTPLLFACYHGHLKLVLSLLARGADIKATDNNGWTALHWAAQRCHADVVEMLLDRGASRSTEDLRGEMPCDVTHDAGLRDCLLPDMEYPLIVSNGYVTTDEEDDDVNENNATNHPAPELTAKVTKLPVNSALQFRNCNHAGESHLAGEVAELCMIDSAVHTMSLAIMERLPSDTTSTNEV